MKAIRKHRPGFTLVEMMVAVSIFATASVMVADLFLIVNRAQRRTTSTEKIQGDARLAFDQITDRIRAGEVDYVGYGGSVPQPNTSVLRILDQYGRSIVIRQSDTVFANTSCASAQSTPCIEMSVGGGAFTPLTSDQLTVTGVKFFVDPPVDPTSGGTKQPRVTIVAGFQGVANQGVPTTFLQTTVSSRVYLR